MRLLIVTQKVDKDNENLGFFHRWLEELAKHCSAVRVIASGVGKHTLPLKVSVHSLGKENGTGRLLRLFRFWKLFWRHYKNADAVFFHMIPESVLAASPFLIFGSRPSVLWYVHKSVTRKLKWAEKLVDYIVTASELSFRLPSKKVIYTGHAIDTEEFRADKNDFGAHQEGLKMLVLGRISPVKDIETVLRAAAFLKEIWPRSWVLSIVGGPAMPRDQEYLDSLKKFVKEKELEQHVHFYGARPYTEVPSLYREHDIFISMSTTGSLDKSVLEAMSSGLNVVTANEAFQDILPYPYFLEKRSPEFLAERIKLLTQIDRNPLLRKIVANQHSLSGTIGKIVKILLTHGEKVPVTG